MSVDQIGQLLRVEMFSSLKEHALQRLAPITHEEAYPAGTYIFRHGDVGDKLYLILDGRVRIARHIQGVGEEALAVLGAGQVFGEMALLDEAPRSADAKAHDRCRLLVITKDAFDDLL